jgi:hypothetical protein
VPPVVDSVIYLPDFVSRREDMAVRRNCPAGVGLDTLSAFGTVLTIAGC